MATKKRDIGDVFEAHHGDFYDLGPIRSVGAIFNIIHGERGPGKSFQMQRYIVDSFWNAYKDGKTCQTMFVRQMKEDIKTVNISTMFGTITCDANGENQIEIITEGKYNDATYYQGAFYLSKYDKDTETNTKCHEPFMYVRDLSTIGHAKNSAFPKCDKLWFEEYVPLNLRYLPNEWKLFNHLLSTVVRKKQDFEVWFTGNAIDALCPYYKQLGLRHIIDQKPGTIEVYRLGHTDNKIAVEHTLPAPEYSASKKVKKYLYAFDDPESNALQSGEWDTGMYPQLDSEVKARDVCGRFFVEYEDNTLECDIVSNDDGGFIYVHRNVDILDPIDYDIDLIYTDVFSPKGNYRRKLTQSFSPAENVILSLIRAEKLLFDDNMSGYIFNTYLNWCKGMR